MIKINLIKIEHNLKPLEKQHVNIKRNLLDLQKKKKHFINPKVLVSQGQPK